MSNFVWKGIRAGQYAEGEISALNEDEAAFLLRRDKVIITSLIEAAGGKKKGKDKAETAGETKPPKSVPLNELVLFTKKLATMVRSGLPILEAVKMLRQQTEHKGMRYVISTIHADIERGTGLSDAFAKHAQVFDSVYVNMLRAGEASGKIDEFMLRLVEGMVKAQAIRKKVKSALSYPAMLLVVAVGVVAIMMVYVVPVFQDMFKNQPGGLPAPTQMVVNISEFIRDPLRGGAAVALVVALALGLRAAIRLNAKLRLQVHQLILRLPVFGPIVLKSSLAKIAMIQGNLTGAGVSVLESIDIATRSLNNMVIQNAMTDVKRGVFSGSPLSELFERRAEIFPLTFSAMVQVGERTGRMDEMFGAIASYYEEETETDIGRLASLIEPVMIVFLGGTIGFILVAMYMPMFAVGQTL